MEIMYRVVNLTTNTKLFEKFSTDIDKIIQDFEYRKQIFPDRIDYTSQCFEYKNNEKERILVYIMKFK